MQSRSESTHLPKKKSDLVLWFFMHFLGDGIDVHKAEVIQHTT